MMGKSFNQLRRQKYNITSERQLDDVSENQDVIDIRNACIIYNLPVHLSLYLES